MVFQGMRVLIIIKIQTVNNLDDLENCSDIQ